MRPALLIGGIGAVLVSASGLLFGQSHQKPERLETQLHVTVNYLLYLPPDYEQKAKWPLMLFLHGAGERGSDLNLVKKHGPPKLIEEGKQFPFLVVSPQCPKDRLWESSELTALLDDVVAKYKVDKDRIYLTGLSMGGFGTWALAAESPNRFAALVPVCGGGEPLAARRLAHVPVWVFHGGKDPVVPLRRSQEMVDALKKSGGRVEFTVYPDAGHDSWTATYDNPKLYEWLLAQAPLPTRAAHDGRNPSRLARCRSRRHAMHLKTSEGEVYFNPQLIAHVHLSADHSLLTVHFVNGTAFGVSAETDEDRMAVADFLGKLSGETSGFLASGNELLNLRSALWITIPDEGPIQLRSAENRTHALDSLDRERIRKLLAE